MFVREFRNSEASGHFKELAGPISAEALHMIGEIEASGDLDFGRRLVELFLKNGPIRVEKIATAIRAGDAVHTASAAHELKSAICFLGAYRLGELCDRIEILAGKGWIVECWPSCVQIAREFAKAAEFLVLEFFGQRIEIPVSVMPCRDPAD